GATDAHGRRTGQLATGHGQRGASLVARSAGGARHARALDRRRAGREIYGPGAGDGDPHSPRSAGRLFRRRSQCSPGKARSFRRAGLGVLIPRTEREVESMSFPWKSAGSYEDILYETWDGIAKITINR